MNVSSHYSVHLHTIILILIDEDCNQYIELNYYKKMEYSFIE